MAVEDDKHFLMECDSLSKYRNKDFDDLEQIVPSFSSKNVDEKFTFIMECKRLRHCLCMYYKYLYN